MHLSDYDESTQDYSYFFVNTIPTLHGIATGGEPPMVAFGSQGGGSPLYVNQNYSFGIAAGILRANNAITIEVYDRKSFFPGATNVAPICTKSYNVSPLKNQDTWNIFANNGYVQDYHLKETIDGKTIDFDTQIRLVHGSSQEGWEADTWGVEYPYYSLLITHRAADASYYYKVNIKGATINQDPSNPSHFSPMAITGEDDSMRMDNNLSYSLDFEEQASWQSVFINQPHFQSQPLPSAYQGKSIDELIHQASPVTDTLTAPEETGFNLTQLNNSSELKNHPELDQLVADYDNDPKKLANYVINHIELTDAIGFNTANEIDRTSINPQGISRDALAT